MMQAVALIMVSITVTSVLALAFAPISLFFLISAHSYAFFKLLNVAILVLAAMVGLRFLTSGMAALNQHQQQRPRRARPACSRGRAGPCRSPGRRTPGRSCPSRTAPAVPVAVAGCCPRRRR